MGTWRELTAPSGPAARDHHAAAYAGDALFVHGGKTTDLATSAEGRDGRSLKNRDEARWVVRVYAQLRAAHARERAA